MPMSPCSKCLESQWKYEFNEGIVTATCGYCENQVSFMARSKRKSSGLRPAWVGAGPTDAYKSQDPNDNGVAPWD